MWPSLLNTEEREQILHYCFECYGVSKGSWQNYDLFKRKEGLWIAPIGTKDKWLDVYQDGERLPPEGIGLRVLSGKSFPYKITASFYQVFKEQITKRLIELSEEQSLALIHRKEIKNLTCEELVFGYYIGVYKNRFIGILLLGKEGWISQVPKSFSSQISLSLKLD